MMASLNRLNMFNSFNMTFPLKGWPCQVVCRDTDTGWGWPRRSKVPETLKVSWPANPNQYMCQQSTTPIVQAVPTYSWGQCGQALVPVHLPQVVQQGELNSWTSKVRGKYLRRYFLHIFFQLRKYFVHCTITYFANSLDDFQASPTPRVHTLAKQAISWGQATFSSEPGWRGEKWKVYRNYRS